MKYSLKRGSNILTRDGDVIIRNYTPPIPPISEDLMFLYLANDYDGTKIPNRATNGLMGDYQAFGQIIKNGSGSSCYLSNNLNTANYLYTSFSTSVRDILRATSNTVTYFVRVRNSGYSTGGIISFRCGNGSGPGDNYCYMIRTAGDYLEVHFEGGYQLDNFTLTDDSVVYKLEFNSSGVNVTNLYTMQSEYLSNSYDRGMGTDMFSFVAGCGAPGSSHGYEPYLDAFYGIAGIKRATTSEEDEYFKNMLLTQGVV